MPEERVVASVTLKSRSGLSVFSDISKLSRRRIDEFRPKATDVDRTVDRLTQAGFTIEAQTKVGISFSGSASLFQAEFGTGVKRKEVHMLSPRGKERSFSFLEASQPVVMSDRIAPYAEAVQVAIPGYPFHNAAPPAPAYYHLSVLGDVPTRLNVPALHTAGTTGTGVRVSMTDTGFVTRVTETHVSDSSTQVTVMHTVRHVQGIWLATDPAHTGTNYYTGGSFAGTTLTLGAPLPGAHTNVEVVYSCFHPHYLNQGYTIDDVRAVGGLDINTDEYGHGTAEAANVLAVAPGATFSFVKYSDGMGSSFPLAGFQAAVSNQNPDVITCSWGTGSFDAALNLEIADAVDDGIVVIFACGNGHTDTPDAWNAESVVHPDLIAVGGAYPIQAGGFRASNYASSFDSYYYTSPQRHAPDVVGLVGDQPRAALIMLPTEPENGMDSGIACGAGETFPDCDHTDDDDGWCVCSGTSASAPQTAGLAALLLQRYPTLTPDAVKNILENSASDVTTGSTNSSGPDSAAAGWDPATGFGLIDGQAALGFLQLGQFNAYIRDSIEDNGTEPVVANRLYSSPDIIVTQAPLTDPQEELGLTVKHRYDLSDDVEQGQNNYVYLRVQNRGTVTGDCTATLYFSDPGMFSNPAAWTNLGSVTIQDLAPGEFRVVGPITWANAHIPGTGHYCLISILDSATDPAPNLGAISTVQDFTDMVRDSNNVAWKNISIKNLVPGGSSTYSFYIEGPAGGGHHADLEIDVSGLPAGTDVVVRLVKRLVDTATLTNLTLDTENSVYKYLEHSGGLAALRSMDFLSNECSQVVIYYTLPAGTPHGDYPIVARLYVDGSHTGSYTEVARVFSWSLIGNRRSMELHRVGCVWERKMSARNRVPMGDLDRAHGQGYDNCAFCLGGSLR